jgi:predicted phage tail protein
MITALISFLGGSAFRLIFGAVMDFFNKKQDHEHEMELQRLQSELEEQRHVRDLARIRLQSDLKVEEVKVVADAAISTAEANAFVEAVRATAVKTGVWWADAWNAAIRPAGATVSLVIWVATMIAAGFVLREFDQTLIAAFLGVFVGERIHNTLRK